MAQGAKPGEGGQLPGHKVDQLHRLRPPHDAGRRPDLAAAAPRHLLDRGPQAADLRPALREPERAVSVKLVAEVGVGTVAAGVAKANADHVLISGHDGGTGASPLSSIQSAGIPWEIGLAETQQTLVLQRPALAHLGADRRPAEDRPRRRRSPRCSAPTRCGFSTAPLIATGCIMMRACHLNTCPVGIATQDPELRKRFAGTARARRQLLLLRRRGGARRSWRRSASARSTS